jgi:hypothetical protein
MKEDNPRLLQFTTSTMKLKRLSRNKPGNAPIWLSTSSLAMMVHLSVTLNTRMETLANFWWEQRK